MDETRRCALTGCEVPIESVPGRPERRYCSAAHRAAARRARRAATAPVPAAASLGDSLPWLHAVQCDGSPPRHDAPGGSPSGGPVSGGRLPVAAPVAAGPTAPGGPGGRARSGSSSPLAGRRRALALVGAAGILAGGYAVVVVHDPAPSSPLPARSALPDADAWAARARVTLASLSEQLDVIAEAEQAWARTPESRRAGRPPAQIREMRAHRAELERQQVLLKVQLQDYGSLPEVRSEVVAAERMLRDAERALADAPPLSQRTPEQDATIAELTERRDRAQARLEDKRAELVSLEQDVAGAAARPLPEPAERTERVTERVFDVVDGENRPERPLDPIPPRPEVVAGREGQDGKPRADVDNSAPPDPLGPLDRKRGRDRDRGPVDAVGGAVGGVLAGDGEADDDGADDRGITAAVDDGGGTVSTVGDAAGSVADTVGDSAGTVGDVADSATGGALIGGGRRSDEGKPTRRAVPDPGPREAGPAVPAGPVAPVATPAAPAAQPPVRPPVARPRTVAPAMVPVLVSPAVEAVVERAIEQEAAASGGVPRHRAPTHAEVERHVVEKIQAGTATQGWSQPASSGEMPELAHAAAAAGGRSSGGFPGYGGAAGMMEAAVAYSGSTTTADDTDLGGDAGFVLDDAPDDDGRGDRPSDSRFEDSGSGDSGWGDSGSGDWASGVPGYDDSDDGTD